MQFAAVSEMLVDVFEIFAQLLGWRTIRIN